MRIWLIEVKENHYETSKQLAWKNEIITAVIQYPFQDCLDASYYESRSLLNTLSQAKVLFSRFQKQRLLMKGETSGNTTLDLSRYFQLMGVIQDPL